MKSRELIAADEILDERGQVVFKIIGSLGIVELLLNFLSSPGDFLRSGIFTGNFLYSQCQGSLESR